MNWHLIGALFLSWMGAATGFLFVGAGLLHQMSRLNDFLESFT